MALSEKQKRMAVAIFGYDNVDDWLRNSLSQRTNVKRIENNEPSGRSVAAKLADIFDTDIATTAIKSQQQRRHAEAQKVDAALGEMFSRSELFRNADKRKKEASEARTDMAQRMNDLFN